jgi:hypothetical protein
MATWHHLNEQLFMPASMLRTELEGSDLEMTTKDVTRSGHPSEDAFWNRKSDEAYKSGLHTSLRKEGMVNPIRLGRSRGQTSIVNGAHRIAAAHDIDPSWMVPVTYKEAVNDPETQSDRLPGHVHREDETYLHELD